MLRLQRGVSLSLDCPSRVHAAALLSSLETDEQQGQMLRKPGLLGVLVTPEATHTIFATDYIKTIPLKYQNTKLGFCLFVWY